MAQRATRLAAASHPLSAEECIHIVDADAGRAEAVRVSLEAEGLNVRVAADLPTLIRGVGRSSAGCVIAGRCPPASDLPAYLARRGIALPIVVISDRGDIGQVRVAFRRGVVDFLQKPIDKHELLRAVRRALDRDRLNRAARENATLIEKRLGRLSTREQQVMAMACEGYQNREIAALIGISPRTVEVHKAHLMEKLKVRTLVELMRVREQAAAIATANRSPRTTSAGAD